MKNNMIIGGCIASLFVLAIILITITTSAAGGGSVSASAGSPTVSHNWYYKPTKDHSQPVVADDAPFIDNYNTIYMGDPDSNKLYITFDMGYENGYTETILDALKEHGVKAAFFVTGHYVSSAPDIVCRMANEGHLVCNHTLLHKDMTSPTDELWEEEVYGLEESYREATGRDMPKYIRPPEGVYSEAFLDYATENGYTTVFWSFAYKDWLVDDQPSRQEAVSTIMERTHPGSIILLHGTSATNAEIMSDIIEQWRDDGYTFGTLDELAQTHGHSPVPTPK